MPRDLTSQLDYFEDQYRKIEPAGQLTSGSRFAVAQLEIRAGRTWRFVWKRRLANDVAPVSAIVRDDGKFVATFDDWHRVGYGASTLVIYGPQGDRVRALSLSDIVPETYIKALPHSVSSIGWHGDPRFSADGKQVLIPVAIPGSDKTFEMAVDLFSGRVKPINRVAWSSALAAGRSVLAAQETSARAAKVRFLAPLMGSKVNAEREWHEYIREAIGRLVGDDVVPSTTVLRAPNAADYAVSEGWVREALTDSFADIVGIASLSEPNLVNVLRRIGSSVPPRSLAKITVFIAASDRSWPAVAAAMKRSGAKLVQLNPEKPIPQRRERIRRRYPDRAA